MDGRRGDPEPEVTAVRGGAGGVQPAGPPNTGRAGLDRRRIIGAAVEYIAEHGLAALSMRRLGAQLGVEAMALYRYVPGREQLLDGVVEAVMDELYGDPHVLMAPQHGWQDYLQRLSHGVRRIALTYPQVFPLIATRPPEAPWIRPPLRSLRWLESFFEALTSSGFSDEAAVGAYRAYTSFLLGHLLLEVAQHGVPITSEDDPDGRPGRGMDAATYPHVARLQPLLTQDESAIEFEESLENLLGRLESLLRAPGGRRLPERG